jgi:hypothetical protein
MQRKIILSFLLFATVSNVYAGDGSDRTQQLVRSLYTINKAIASRRVSEKHIQSLDNITTYLEHMRSKNISLPNLEDATTALRHQMASYVWQYGIIIPAYVWQYGIIIPAKENTLHQI